MSLDAKLLALAQAIGLDFKARGASSLTFVLDGGGVAIVAGQEIDLPALPFDCTVTGWTITADVAGSAVVDIKRATYANFPTMASLAGVELPTLSAVQKNRDIALTTWGTALAAGDVLRASVTSASTVKRLTITLSVTRA